MTITEIERQRRLSRYVWSFTVQFCQKRKWTTHKADRWNYHFLFKRELALLALLKITNVVVVVGIYPDWEHCSLQSHTNRFVLISNSMSKRSNLFKLDQAWSNWIKLVQTWSSLIKLDQTCSNLMKLVHKWSNLFKLELIVSK